jgi:hypothetical protein
MQEGSSIIQKMMNRPKTGKGMIETVSHFTDNDWADMLNEKKGR